MDKFISFFDHIQSWQRSLILVAGLLLFWILEGLFPVFLFRFNRYKHAGINIIFTITTILVNFIFAFLIVKTSSWEQQEKLGLLYLTKMPTWLFALTGLLLLDLIGAWLIHFIQHKVKWMWKFHLIHHSDTWVDVTTANRHHPGESVFRFIFTWLAVAVTGAPMWLIFLYQALSVLVSQFTHANIHLPKWIDTALSWIFVSPDMHKVHHHYTQPLTDTNYGNIFSVWDRLFGTFASVKDVKSLQYGIDSYPDVKEHNHLGKLMRIPFDPYRPPPGGKFTKKK